MIDDRRFREKIATVEIELKALEMTQLRVVSAERSQGRAKTPDPASSILKLKGSEIQQSISELLMEGVGPYALPFQPEIDGRNDPPIGPADAGPRAPTDSTGRTCASN